MRRRKPDPTPDNLPPKLAEFNPEDWWVRDLEDELEVGYARITWATARRAYLEGDDWESYTLMPAWMAFRGDGPVPEATFRHRTERRVSDTPRTHIEGHPIRNH